MKFLNKHSQSYSSRISALCIGLCVAFSSAIPAGATPSTYDIKDSQSVIGEVRYIEAREGDTLLIIANEFKLGYEELVAANRKIDTWDLKRGTRVILPTRFILPKGKREGIYINTANYRLFYYPKKYKGNKVITYPISVGRGEWPTPKKSTSIIEKLVNPNWYPPLAVRKEHKEWGEELPNVVPPGPDNPLGEFALQLGLPGYLIHGTNKPYGIGMNVTHGCIRLHPDAIERIFKMVPRKTKVHIIDEPYTLAVEDNVVYFEAHADSIENDAGLATKLTKTLKRTLTDKMPAIDWQRFSDIAGEQRGIPAAINWGWQEQAAQEVIQFQERLRESTATQLTGRPHLF